MRTHAPKSPKMNRQGFSLLTIVVVIAVVAILAGVLGPMLYRQAIQKRVNATRDEMLALRQGLLDFQTDTGRFPTAGEGLVALVTDPGITGWQGPYVSGVRYEAQLEIVADAFGNDYAYDTSPETSPPGTADVLLASMSSDGSFSSGRVGSVWDLNDDGDDIVLPVDAGATDRAGLQDVDAEMRAIAAAALAYFEDEAAFPASTTALLGTYLDRGTGGGALQDPWRNDYLVVVNNSAQPATFSLRCSGPDGVDDGGGGDDVVLAVDATAPGRRATLRILGVAQSRLDASPTLVLTGDWSIDGAALGLSSAHLVDGWGQPLDVAVSMRTVVSAGPDGDFGTVGDNLPVGVVPD
jgi:general secretion pathway protein G